MTRTLSMFIALCLTSSVGFSQDGLKIYNTKSGILEYKHSGTTNGTSKMYFDNFGNLSAAYSDLKRGGEASKGWVITRGDVQYMFDPDKGTGMKFQNPIVASLRKVKDLEKFAEQTYAAMGMKSAGTEKFLGKDCRAFKGSMGKVLTWNGILMLMEMDVMGQKTRQEATKIEINVPVKASLFEVPKNIKFSEGPGF